MPEPPRWLSQLAKLVHIALNRPMIGRPFMGWLILSAAGKVAPFFGLELPHLVAESRSVADWAKEFHGAGGTVGYFLIGLNAAAAIAAGCSKSAVGSALRPRHPQPLAVSPTSMWPNT